MFGARSRQGLARGARVAMGRSRTSTMTKQRRKYGMSGQGVTTQHDQRLIYRKKNMPRRKKNSWRRFIKKINAVSERELGTRTVVFSSLYSRVNETIGNHCDGAVYLYGMNGNELNSGSGDMARIGALENEGNPTADAGATTYKSTKFMFQSAVLDITFRNVSGVITAQGGVDPDSRARLEVDVYELLINFDQAESGTSYNNVRDMMNRNATNTAAIGGGANVEVLRTQRGTTPWDLPYFLSRYRVKILRKTKYQVNNQDTFTYQCRDPRRRVIMQKEMEDSNSFNKPGWTRTIHIIAKLVPGLVVGNLPGQYLEQYQIGCTRKYMYKIEGITDDRSAYLTV